MELSERILSELQKRLKIGNRRGVHLNGIPAKSGYKFDVTRLSHIDKKIPGQFISSLLHDRPLKFRISWKDNVPDLNTLLLEDQSQLVSITKSFENLINQTGTIEAEKGINTFGFGFPMLIRRDMADNQLAVAPILIWSLRVKRTKEFNTWEISRGEEDNIYINEVLINHLANDAKVEIAQIPDEMLEDGVIDPRELIDICLDFLKSINSKNDPDLKNILTKKLQEIVPIRDKKYYEGLPLTSTNAFIEFGGLFSIFEVQKQNIINDYDGLMDLAGLEIGGDDLEGQQFQSLSSVQTDPSQQSVLNSLGTKRNVVIQGPPGTGKSQSLTAVLVNALENKKKTIVVCEKKTALEVLENALVSKGLKYHCVLIKDIVKDRKTVVDSVRDRLDGNVPGYRNYFYQHSAETLGELTGKAQELVESINAKHLKLDQQLLANQNWTHIVGRLLKEKRNSKDEHQPATTPSNFRFSIAELNQYLEFAKRGQELWDKYTPYRALSFLNPARLLGQNQYKIEQEILSSYDQYKSKLMAFSKLKMEFKTFYISKRAEELDKQFELVKTLKGIRFKADTLAEIITDYRSTFNQIKSEHYRAQFNQLNNCLDEIIAFAEAHIYEKYFLDEQKIRGFGFKLTKLFSSQARETQLSQQTLVQKLDKFAGISAFCEDISDYKPSGQLAKDLDSCRELRQKLVHLTQNIQNVIDEQFAKLNFLFAMETPYRNEFSDALYELCTELSATLGESKHHRNLTQAAKMHIVKTLERCRDLLPDKLEDGFEKLDAIDEQAVRTAHVQVVNSEFDQLNLLTRSKANFESELCDELKEAIARLRQLVEQDAWTKISVDDSDHHAFETSLQNILREKEIFFSHEEDIFTAEFNWFNFYNNLQTEQQACIDELKDKRDWRRAFLIRYLHTMLINAAEGDLPVDDRDHEYLNQLLGGLEKDQMRFIREYWYSVQHQRQREFESSHPNFSVENLYNKRSSYRYQRLSLRMIAQYDIDLFTSYFPIVLTTPDVASNLFKGKNGYFDLVVFDEASQLRLEDNLPAILKGKQVIIAGDEHQMPPSNYFSKVYEGTVEDEEDIEDEKQEVYIDKDNMLLSCESLLDFATELNFEKRYLDFHYRSKHPYLIDFSNYAFYNQRLRPVPNDFDYVPIRYMQVGGTFSDHTNEAEADAVIQILEHQIQRLPGGDYPSVGIATFNISQRNLILNKIQQRQRISGNYSDFNQKIVELEANGLFVKNLENIQGDERDVIIISTTYGHNKDGKFYQRFGPVTHGKGYKLLNVIVTRAKYRVYVCCSIPEVVFMNYKAHLVTEQANNKRAAFFAYLAYAKAVSEQDEEARRNVLGALAENSNAVKRTDQFHADLESPFEEEVYAALADHFDAKHLFTQVEFAGFRIDMVFDPLLPGKSKIAIECDGAKYHSSQEAYLYDLYRQQILEQHGFIFHRIWSTAWWRNTPRETQKMVAFIKSITDNSDYISDRFEQWREAFEDEPLELLQTLAKPGIGISIKNQDAWVEPDDKGQRMLFDDIIQLGSQVDLRLVNSDKILKIKIVSQQQSFNEAESSVQNVSVDAPLGRSLLGKSKDAIVQVGDLDNFVEVLAIN